MKIDELRSIKKTSISEVARGLSSEDVAFLVGTLTEKDDTIRYNAFLLLQATSRDSPSVYKHWNTLTQKLKSDNSYQRSIGVMLLSENLKWDNEGRFKEAIDSYLDCCLDEKFITARQAIQGLATILNSTKAYDQKIKSHLTKLSLQKYKDNQQKLLVRDVAKIIEILDER